MALKYRFALVVFILQISVLAVTLLPALLDSQQTAGRLTQQTFDVTLDLIANVGFTALVTDDLGDLQAYLETVSESPQVNEIIITDKENRIVAASRITRLGGRFLRNGEGKDHPWEVKTILGQSGKIGQVAARFSGEALTEEFQRILYKGGGIGLAVIFLIVFLSYFSGVLLTRRLNYLVLVADEVTAGQFNKKALLQGSDEISRVGQALDGMIDRVSAGFAEQVKVFEALRQSEKRLRDFVESSSDWLWELDENLRFIYLSENFKKITGVDPVQTIGKTKQEHIAENKGKVFIEDPEKWAQVFADMEAHKPYRALRSSWITASGTKRYVSTSGKPYFDEMGIFKGYRGVGVDITENVIAEMNLQESEARLREAQEIAHLGHWERDIATGMNTWSAEAYRIFGVDPDEFFPSLDNLIAMVHPDDRENIIKQTEKAIQENTSYDFQYRITRPNGGERILYATSGKVIFDETGQPSKLRGVVLDITEKIRAETALSKSEALLKTIFESLPVGLFVKDSDTRYLMVNKKFGEINQVDSSQAKGYTHEELKIGNDALNQSVAEEDRRILKSGERIELPRREEILGEGNRRWVHVIKSPLRSADGKIIGLIGIVDDITDRVLAEDALREAEERFSGVVEHSPAAIFLKDLHGRFQLVNRRFEDWYGISNREIIGKASGDIFPRKFAESYLAHDRQVLESGASVEKEYDVPFADGNIHRVVAAKYPVFNSVGDITGIATISSDVTEKKRADEELIKRDRIMKKAEQVAHIGSVEWDLVAKTQYWSDEVWRIVGRKPQSYESSEKVFADTLHPDDKKRVLLAMSESVRGGKDFDLECRVVRPGGAIRTVHAMGELLLDESGKPLRMTGTVHDITERKVAEEALLAHEQLMESVFDNVPAAISMKDTNGRIVFANQLYERWFGSSELTVIGKTISEILPAHAEAAGKRDVFVRENLTMVVTEEEIPFQDGVKHFTQIVKFPVLSAKKALEGIGVIVTDISEHRKAEEARLDSERRFRRLIEDSQLALIILRNLKPVFVNQAFVDLFGYGTRQEVMDLPNIEETMREEDRQRIKGRHFEDMKGNIQEPRYERIAIRKDGAVIWVEVLIDNVEWDDIPAVLVFFIDITERKLAQEDRLNLTMAVEHAADAVVITDHRGTIQYVNPSFERITGFTRQETIGNNPRILKSGKQDRKFYRNMWRMILQGKNWEGILINRRKDGSFYEEEMTIASIKDAAGKVVNFIAVKRDITERREVEERIKRQEQQLIQADKMASLGILVSGMAHEINNPNSFITFNAPILARIWEDAIPILKHHREENGDFSLASLPFEKTIEAVPRLLSGISNGAERIKNIVANLKDFARQDPGGEFKPVNLNAVLESATTLLSNEINKRTKHFSVEYGKDLPKVLGDFQKIEQVVINLINNACQALPAPEKAVRVKTGIDTGSAMVKLSVADEGEGISPENLAKIMDPFFTTKRDSGGTGLGLSVSYSIMEEHGGRLEYSSTQGEGTTAVIFIPLLNQT